jgi:hypothetical protein
LLLPYFLVIKPGPGVLSTAGVAMVVGLALLAEI